MKSKLNDAELIAETYANSRPPEAQVTAQDSSDVEQEHSSCTHAEQGCNCTDCPECEANDTTEEAPAVDQESSCGYDQVAEPEVKDADDEVHITLSDLHKTLKCAAALYQLLSNASEITGDVTVKIARAADILGGVYDKLDYDLNGFSIQNTGHEDVDHV